jgi:hypothetical protein
MILAPRPGLFVPGSIVETGGGFPSITTGNIRPDRGRGILEGMLVLGSLCLALTTGSVPRPPVTPTPVELVAPPGPDAIVGGEPVEPGEHPAVVSVSVGGGACTGTLLTPELVLTAAHCLQGAFVQPSFVRVGLGEDEHAPTQPLGVAALGTHPEFWRPRVDEGCDDDVHDYAWLRLDAPAAIDEAALPTVVTDEALHHRLVRAGASVELVGFGEDDEGRLGLKRRVTTTIAAFSASGQELRIGGSGHDSCDGDSGGPALARRPDGGLALVGVLSRGSKPCGQGGIYGAPLPALCWIRDDAGVDVVPAGCEACDCIDLTPREEAGGCRAVGARALDGWWWLVAVAMPWSRRRGGRGRAAPPRQPTPQ